MNLLTAENVCVRRGGRLILDSVSLQVARGAFTAVVGPNGSGKSTLLRALTSVWEVSGGSIRIGDRAISEVNRRELAQRIAFVPQDTRMDFAFTVEEVVAMGRYPRRGRFEPAHKDDRRAIEAAIGNCDVRHLRGRFVTTLSGGERQRVAIARSLAAEPDIILLDEPTANLDVQHALEVLDLCKALAVSGKSIVLATHDLNAVSRYAKDVVLLEAGRVAFRGACEDILTTDVLDRVFGVRAQRLQSSGGHSLFLFERKPGPE